MTDGHADGHPVPVDLDLLADYDCGALAGTADESRVAALIDADPAWAAAYAGLAAADPLVRADLAELGAAPEPMPAAVLHRALAALPAEPVEQPAPVRELPVTRRRRYRPLLGWAAAAAVVVLAGIGLTVGLHATGGTNSSGADDASGRTPANSAPRSGPAVMGKQTGPDDQPNPEKVLLTASGTDYTRAALSRVTAAGASGAMSAGQLTGVPAGLSRLTDMSELNLCLRAVATVHPGTARLVDYARFEGSPALIVVLDGGTVVAGPSCGRNGADIRYQTGQ